MTVAVAVVSYNTRDVLRACLASVVADAPAEVVVADNGSTDGSVEMVRAEFPGARVTVDRSNPGYGAAANRAVAACSAPYVLVLNSDTVLPVGTLAALHAYAERHPRAGMVGPRLRNADGSLQPSCRAFPSTRFLLVEYTPLRPLLARLPGARARYFVDWPHDRARPVPWLTGAALLVRRAAFDAVGGFDPSFHMYFEEVDLAWRMAEAGWETHFAPVADVVHLGGTSTAAARVEMRVRHFRSLVQFRARHGSRVGAVRLAIVLAALVRGAMAVDAARARWAGAAGGAALADRRDAWRRLARVPLVREALAGGRRG